MKPILKVSVFAAAVGLIAIGASMANSENGRMPPRGSGPRSPVLVELFTSEGCSDCPSADALLTKLQKAQPVSGALIVPLSEHVDYWNNANWKDRFSSHQFSDRQGAYVRALHQESLYTPEMVVDGQSQFVGSDEKMAEASIAKAALKRKANVTLNAGFNGEGGISVSISVDNLPVASAGNENQIYIALTENALSSKVRGGENEGRRLAHTAVVRVLQRLDSMSVARPYNRQIDLKLDPTWKRSDLEIIGFVQEAQSGRIMGVGMATQIRP